MGTVYCETWVCVLCTVYCVVSSQVSVYCLVCSVYCVPCSWCILCNECFFDILCILCTVYCVVCTFLVCTVYLLCVVCNYTIHTLHTTHASPTENSQKVDPSLMVVLVQNVWYCVLRTVYCVLCSVDLV